jgi:hypothetical protein
MTKQRLSFIGTMAVGVLCAWSADAAVTVYPGTFCVRANSTQHLTYQNARASNNSTSDAFVICPAIQQGKKLLSATVWGRDISTIAGVSCHYRISNQFDTSATLGPTVSTGNIFTGNFALGLGEVADPGFLNPGSKGIDCTVPTSFGGDGSSIGAYRINEE